MKCSVAFSLGVRETKSSRFHGRIARIYDSEYEDRSWAVHGYVEWRTLEQYLPKRLVRFS